MVRVELVIRNELGFHARAAAKFVQEAARFESEVWLLKSSKRVNGKSIMGILTLAAAKGERVILEVEGPDEKDTIEVLSKLVDGGFDEDKEQKSGNRD
jgi:phosphocarrier protein